MAVIAGTGFAESRQDRLNQVALLQNYLENYIPGERNFELPFVPVFRRLSRVST